MPRASNPPSIGASLVSAADVKSAGGSTASPLAARAFILLRPVSLVDLGTSLFQLAQNVGADLPFRRAGLLPVLAPAHRPSPFTMATVIAACGAPVIGNVSRVFP